MAKSGNGPRPSASGAGRRKPDYGIDAATFVAEWEKAANMNEVYEALKAISEKNGYPVMPKPIILARAALYRSAKVPLKKMPRVRSNAIDVKGLTDLVMKIRAQKAAEQPAATTEPVAQSGVSPEQLEAVVRPIIERIIYEQKEPPKPGPS